MFLPLGMLRGHAATKIFLWYLLLPVVLCFMSGKWRTQVADQIPQVFGEVLASHLVKVIAPLFIWHHDDKLSFCMTDGSPVAMMRRGEARSSLQTRLSD
jgi:hypothetical protein